ncbi:MAG TPA: HAMP domain-containing sensor histidine kinase [Candidatus Xenobia bacterium]|jgi:signal transduction histidine kinase
MTDALVLVLVGLCLGQVVLLRRLRAEKERVEKLEGARRDFLADVSHNLGTPLAAVLGWTELLLEAKDMPAAERVDKLHRIARDVQYVSKTVKQLLDLSRLEASPPELRLEVFPLLEPLMEVVESLAEAAAENGTKLSFDGISPACRVRADRVRVREVLQVLLENVVAHAGKNASAVVAVKAQEGRWLVTLTDDGIGIETGRLNHLQRRFFPSGGTGAGLGLSIAHRLVAAHGGVLDLAQLTGGGTQATFSLPQG